MKYIKKVAVSPIPPINGSVVDTFNVTDKITNAPSVNAVEQYIKAQNTYSTEETFTGKYWIDGKKIYRKLIIYKPTETIGAMGKTTEIIIPHNIANLQRRFIEFACNDSGVSLPIMGSSNGTAVTAATMIKQIDGTDVIMRIINDTWGTTNTFHICINYTKTTD
jgi:hypothetical protein